MYDMFLHDVCFYFGVLLALVFMFSRIVLFMIFQMVFLRIVDLNKIRTTLRGAPILALFFDAAPRGVFWELLLLLVVPVLPHIGSNCAVFDASLATCWHPFDIIFHGIGL